MALFKKKKNTGKRKTEVNFSGRYQGWRAPWIVTEGSAGRQNCLQVCSCCVGGSRELVFPLFALLSLVFLRGVPLIELFVLSGHGPPPAVIFKWCKEQPPCHKSSKHLLTLSVVWKEKLSLSQHWCWLTALGSQRCPRADLCRLHRFVFQKASAACGTWPHVH